MNDIKSNLTSLIVKALNDEKLISKEYMEQINGIYGKLSNSESTNVNDLFPVLTKLKSVWLLIQIEKGTSKNKLECFKELTESLVIAKDMGINVKDLNKRYNNLK
ncbi:MAG: hypothetical protein PF569_01590 [Candidatus Woesearchaeota archaeon]|jgi:hypothetical protein|nr:hypothetical protein [Candidatus Woesearchaeota archaeon]